jgi:hypothetical protein
MTATLMLVAARCNGSLPATRKLPNLEGGRGQCVELGRLLSAPLALVAFVRPAAVYAIEHHCPQVRGHVPEVAIHQLPRVSGTDVMECWIVRIRVDFQTQLDHPADGVIDRPALRLERSQVIRVGGQISYADSATGRRQIERRQINLSPAVRRYDRRPFVPRTSALRRASSAARIGSPTSIPRLSRCA